MTAPTQTLGKRVAIGALWMSGAKVFTHLITMIRLVIVAALLPQDQIGLFGLAAIAMQLLEQLSQTGMQVALIQRKGDIRDYLGTAWITQVVRGVFLSIAVLLLANPIAGFFDEPRLPSLLHVLALVPVFLGIQNMSLVRLHRELRFGKVVGIQVGMVIVDLLICVLIAVQSPTAVALVWGRVGSSIFAAAASFLLERRRFKLAFSTDKFRELYSFGFWIFVAAILGFTLVRGGDIVIGKLLTTEDLAVYQIAYAMACGPIMEIMSVVGGTALPAYSQLQDQPARLSSAFLRILASSSFVASLSIAGFAVLGRDFTALFFRPEYGSMAAILPALAIWGACRGLGATNSVLFQALGRPALATLFQFIMVVFFVTLLIPLSRRYGVNGTVYSLVAIGLTAQVLRYSLVIYVAKIPARGIFMRLAIPLGVAAFSGVATLLTISLISADSHAARLAVGVCVLLLVFASASYWFDGRCRFGLRDFAHSISPRRLGFLRSKHPGRHT